MKSILPVSLLCLFGSLPAMAETWGDNTSASGDYSTAWGTNTDATGSWATAWGFHTESSGIAATALGVRTIADGNYSTTWGVDTEASQSYSTAWGNSTKASYSHATAWGYYSEARGYNSTAFGTFSLANARDSVAIGHFNTEFPDVNAGTRQDGDPLFSVGNGTSTSNRSNALTVLRDGTTTINGDVFVYGSVYDISDISLKSNVEPLYFAEDLVMDLNPVSYTMTNDVHQKNQIGFIAQEVEDVLPELVDESMDGYKTVDYAKMTAVLVGAFQALKNENILLADDVQSLKKENALLVDAVCKNNQRAKICRQP